jgi:hypothetical protein
MLNECNLIASDFDKVEGEKHSLSTSKTIFLVNH